MLHHNHVLNDMPPSDLDESIETANSIEHVHELFLLLKFSNIVQQFPPELFKLIIISILIAELPNNRLKPLFTHIVLDESYDELAKRNIDYLNCILKEDAFWCKYSFFIRLPMGFSDMQDVLADTNLSLNLQIFKIKQIANSNMKDLIFGLFAQPMFPYVKQFFHAIINNTLDEFMMEFRKNVMNTRCDLSENARYWG